MINYNVKEVTHRDKPRENYHPTLQFPLALWCFLSLSIPDAEGSCFQQKSSDKPNVHFCTTGDRQG